MAAATFYHQPGPIHHQSFPGYLPSPPSSSSSSSSRNLDFRPRLTMDPATGSGDSASGGWWGNEGHWQAGWSSRQSGRDSAAQHFDPPNSSSSGQGERHQQPDFNSGGASSYQSGDPYHSHRYDHAAEASYQGRRVSPSSTVAPPVSSYPPSLDPTHTPTSPRRPLEPAAEIVPSPPSGKNHQRSEPVSQLAEFAASMICYLWFARTIPKPACSKADQASPSRTDLNPLQFQPTHKFLRFCHDVLTTTQVSHSVVIMALLFVYRLKSRNTIAGSSGSEYRLAVCALMLANKVLDDHTYTAKTWSEVSGLDIGPIKTAEVEFLQGLDYQLYVSQSKFEAWHKLLAGLVAAKESESTRWLGSLSRKAVQRPRRSNARLSARSPATVSSIRMAPLPTSPSFSMEQRQYAPLPSRPAERARSSTPTGSISAQRASRLPSPSAIQSHSSPGPFEQNLPSKLHIQKRSAVQAFQPESFDARHYDQPVKRFASSSHTSPVENWMPAVRSPLGRENASPQAFPQTHYVPGPAIAHYAYQQVSPTARIYQAAPQVQPNEPAQPCVPSSSYGPSAVPITAEDMAEQQRLAEFAHLSKSYSPEWQYPPERNDSLVFYSLAAAGKRNRMVGHQQPMPHIPIRVIPAPPFSSTSSRPHSSQGRVPFQHRFPSNSLNTPEIMQSASFLSPCQDTGRRSSQDPNWNFNSIPSAQPSSLRRESPQRYRSRPAFASSCHSSPVRFLGQGSQRQTHLPHFPAWVANEENAPTPVAFSSYCNAGVPGVMGIQPGGGSSWPTWGGQAPTHQQGWHSAAVSPVDSRYPSSTSTPTVTSHVSYQHRHPQQPYQTHFHAGPH